MIYNEYNNLFKDSKISKVLGCLFIFVGIVTCISILSIFITFKTKEKNYDLQYVYNMYGILSYETNKGTIYVKDVYDFENKPVELDIPNRQTLIMYCSKTNESECLYLDMNNSINHFALNPFGGFILVLFLISIGMYLLINGCQKKNTNKENSSLISVNLFFIFLFMTGIFILFYQFKDYIKYQNIKNNGEIIPATIYSEIYDDSSNKNSYKPVVYYYVNNQKYIYAFDSNIPGNLKEDYGKTIELYYNKNNVEEVVTTKNPLDLETIIICIGIILFTIPFIFFRKKMEKRIDKNIEKNQNKEWSI